MDFILRIGYGKVLMLVNVWKRYGAAMLAVFPMLSRGILLTIAKVYFRY